MFVTYSIVSSFLKTYLEISKVVGNNDFDTAVKSGKHIYKTVKQPKSSLNYLTSGGDLEGAGKPEENSVVNHQIKHLTTSQICSTSRRSKSSALSGAKLKQGRKPYSLRGLSPEERLKRRRAQVAEASRTARLRKKQRVQQMEKENVKLWTVICGVHATVSKKLKNIVGSFSALVNKRFDCLEQRLETIEQKLNALAESKH